MAKDENEMRGAEGDWRDEGSHKKNRRKTVNCLRGGFVSPAIVVLDVVQWLKYSKALVSFHPMIISYSRLWLRSLRFSSVHPLVATFSSVFQKCLK